MINNFLRVVCWLLLLQSYQAPHDCCRDVPDSHNMYRWVLFGAHDDDNDDDGDDDDVAAATAVSDGDDDEYVDVVSSGAMETRVGEQSRRKQLPLFTSTMEMKSDTGTGFVVLVF